MKILSGTSNLNLSKKISKNLKLKLINTNIKRFADGEIYIEINENIRGNSVFVIQSTSNPASISQAAAVEALNGSQSFIKKRAKSFSDRRNFVVNYLNSIPGITCLMPKGAFYVFPSCKGLIGKKTKIKNDTDFVQKLLEKQNVAVVQGSAFGLEGFFRISYATSMENLKKAMDKISIFCKSLN